MTQGLINQVNLLNNLVFALENEKKTLQKQNQRLRGQFALLAQDHDRFAHDSAILRQQNQELYNSFLNLTEQLKRLEGVENALLAKENELKFQKTQNKRFETIIANNKEIINQLSGKISQLEKQLQQKSHEFTQKIRDFENNRINVLKSQNEMNDIRIVELTSEISGKNAQIKELKAKYTQQALANDEQRLALNKKNHELAERYAEAVKANQRYSKSVLSLENYNNEFRSLLEKERTLSAGLQNKSEVDTIVISKLQHELKQERKINNQNISKLNKIITQKHYLVEKQNRQYSDLFQKYQSLQKQKVGGESELSNRLQQQNRVNKALQSQITELNIQIQRLTTQNQELKNQLKYREKQIEEKNAEIDILERKITEKEESINQGQFQQSELRREIEKFRKTKVDLQVQLKSLQEKNQQLRNQTLQDKSQSKKKEDALKQKLLSLQKQVRKLQDEIHSSKLSTLVQGQSKNQKDIELAALRKIINQQQKYIADQKVATERLGQLLSSKEKEIEHLQANNSMLRKQVMNALANQDCTRKEMLMQKQKELSSRRMSKVGSRGQLSRKNSGDQFKKRFTALVQPQESYDLKNGILRRSQHDINGISSQTFKQSFVQKISTPSSDNEFKEI